MRIRRFRDAEPERSGRGRMPRVDGEIVIEKKGDFDLVEMKPSFIEESENGKYNLFLVAIFSRINKYPTKIPQIMIAFYSNSKECKFPENSDTKAKIILDGKTISLSEKVSRTLQIVFFTKEVE